jgi:hypothetical protein
VIFKHRAKGRQRRHHWRAAIVASAAIAISGIAVSGAAHASASPVLAGQHPVQAHHPATFERYGPMAAPSPIPAASSTYNICLENAPYLLCLHSSGTGKQVTITENPADWSNFHTARTKNNDTWYQFEDGNGHCLRAGTNNVVKIENGPCALGDNADWWILESGGQLQSAGYGNDMLTHGDETGYNVWHMGFMSGDWTAWGYLYL